MLVSPVGAFDAGGVATHDEHGEPLDQLHPMHKRKRAGLIARLKARLHRR